MGGPIGPSITLKFQYYVLKIISTQYYSYVTCFFLTSEPPAPAASPLAMQEWMTVIDAAIQGVPEQAKRRLRTVTNHFSVRQKSHGGKKLLDSHQDSTLSLSSTNLEERGLDLSESVMVEDAESAAGATGYIDTE